MIFFPLPCHQLGHMSPTSLAIMQCIVLFLLIPILSIWPICSIFFFFRPFPIPFVHLPSPIMASSSVSLALLTFFAFVLLAITLAQPPMMGPPFLEGAPADKINEFHQLLLGAGTLTDAQIEAKVKEWVAKQSQDIQTKFAAFEKEQDKAREEGEAAHAAAVKNLSEAAKKADKELSEIAEDKQMTAQEKGTRINALMQGLPAKVREELQSAMAMGGGGGGPQQFRSPL